MNKYKYLVYIMGEIYYTKDRGFIKYGNKDGKTGRR